MVKVEQDSILDGSKGNPCTGGIFPVVFKNALFIVRPQVFCGAKEGIPNLLSFLLRNSPGRKGTFGIPLNEGLIYMHGKATEFVAKELLNHKGMCDVPPDIVVETVGDDHQFLLRGFIEYVGQETAVASDGL
jgi:hypothetical protein